MIIYNYLSYINYSAYFDYIKCLQRRLNYEKKASRAQGHMKEQATKDMVMEVLVKVATED
jgi:hypothetical protein